MRWLRFAGQRIVSNSAFRRWGISNEINQIIEVELRTTLRIAEVRGIVVTEKSAADVERMRAVHPTHYVAPIVIVLRVQTGPTGIDRQTNSRHRYAGNGEWRGVSAPTEYMVGKKTEFIDHGR